MAYIIDSLQNYQQQIVDHFKADEHRRSSFQKHMRNSRFKEVMARNRAAPGPGHVAGASKRDGRKIHGPPQGQDPVEYYRDRLHMRKEKEKKMWGRATQPPTAASAPTGQPGRRSDVEPQAPLASSGASTERPWAEKVETRRPVQMDAEDVYETLKKVYSTTQSTSRKAAPYVHYDGRVTAGLPLRLDEMEFNPSHTATGETARERDPSNRWQHQQTQGARPSDTPVAVPTPASRQQATNSGRRPQPPKRSNADEATAAAPPDHTRRVQPTWQPRMATCEQLTNSESKVDRWAAAAPWRERPGEHAGDENHDAQIEKGWPFRILQPRHEQESEVGVGGYRPDVCPSSARSMIAEATTARSRKAFDSDPQGGGWATSEPAAVTRARAPSQTTHAWRVAPPIIEDGRVEYRYHSESQRPVSAVALTADRELDAPARASTASPRPHRRFVFPSKGGPHAVQSAR